MVPRFLNYALLTPFYTRIFKLGEYGVVTELYAYIVVLLVILTYGMETGYFRFTESEKNKDTVFSTALISLFVTSGLFIMLVLILNQPIANALDYAENKEYIALFTMIVGIDAFTAIPFAKLRRENRGLRFAMIKLVNVSVIVLLVFCLLLFIPNILLKNPESWIRRVYSPEIGVGYVFIANLAGSVLTLILLLPEIIGTPMIFDQKLLGRMLKYSFPLLIAGLAGTINEALDKIILKHLLPDPETAMDQLGIYGAGFKIGVIMSLFIQMFRYAAEPFFFARAKEQNAKRLYADVMKYFIICGLIIFLGIEMFIEIVKYFIGPEFWTGLDIVPVILMGYLFYGIFVNLSIWYKLNDLTRFGAILTMIGAFVTVLVNVLFVPVFGYHASAWGHFLCYFVMVIVSYFWGRAYYKVEYRLRSIGIYFIVALLLYLANVFFNPEVKLYELVINLLLFSLFIAFVWMKEDIKRVLLTGRD